MNEFLLFIHGKDRNFINLEKLFEIIKSYNGKPFEMEIIKKEIRLSDNYSSLDTSNIVVRLMEIDATYSINFPNSRHTLDISMRIPNGIVDFTLFFNENFNYLGVELHRTIEDFQFNGFLLEFKIFEQKEQKIPVKEMIIID